MPDVTQGDVVFMADEGLDLELGRHPTQFENLGVEQRCVERSDLNSPRQIEVRLDPCEILVSFHIHLPVETMNPGGNHVIHHWPFSSIWRICSNLRTGTRLIGTDDDRCCFISMIDRERTQNKSHCPHNWRLWTPVRGSFTLR